MLPAQRFAACCPSLGSPSVCVPVCLESVSTYRISVLQSLSVEQPILTLFDLPPFLLSHSWVLSSAAPNDLSGQAFPPHSPPFSSRGGKKKPLFLLWSGTLDCQPCLPLPVLPGWQLQRLFSWHLAFQAGQLVAHKPGAFMCLCNFTRWQFKSNSAVFSVAGHEPGGTLFGLFVHKIMGSLLLSCRTMWSASQRALTVLIAAASIINISEL